MLQTHKLEHKAYLDRYGDPVSISLKVKVKIKYEIIKFIVILVEMSHLFCFSEVLQA